MCVCVCVCVCVFAFPLNEKISFSNIFLNQEIVRILASGAE